MKAVVTRTLQAPQYAPVVMTLEEECTPDTYAATLNKLADLIETTLRERYPQYAGVLPQVPKKAEIKSGRPLSHGEALRSQISREKVINIQRGKALIECINNCRTLSQLKDYELFLDSDEADKVYKEKLARFQPSGIAV